MESKNIIYPREGIPTEPSLEDISVPMRKAKKGMFDLLLKSTYRYGYTDDILTIVIDSSYLILRGIHTVPLIYYIFFRPVHLNEPIKRSDVISTSKLLAEGELSKTKMFLGLTIDTRRLRIFLPKLKALKWINEIDELLKLDKVTEGNKNMDVKMNIADSNDQIEPKNSSYSENFDNDAN